MNMSTFMGVVSGRIDRKANIDCTKCDYFMECARFCPQRVFEVMQNEEIEMIVKNPEICDELDQYCFHQCFKDYRCRIVEGKTPDTRRNSRKWSKNSESINHESYESNKTDSRPDWSGV